MSPNVTRQAGWFVRAVALLLVAAGLQAGSFRDLDAAQDFYFGSADYSSAVLPDKRKALGEQVEAANALDRKPAPGADDAPAISPVLALLAPAHADATRHAPLAAFDFSHPPRLVPEPTGPPRA